MQGNITISRPITKQEKITCSPELLHALEQQSVSNMPSTLPYLPRAVVQEAHDVAEALKARYLTPPAPQRLREFISELFDALNASVRNPTDNRALSVRVGITCRILADIPSCVLCEDFLTVCFSECKFLPAPADILEMARKFSQTYRDKVAKLKLVGTFDKLKIYTLGHQPPEENISLAEDEKHIIQQEMTIINGKFPTRRRDGAAA